MNECTCYWIDAPAREKMLNPECPEHGSVSKPIQPKVIWPDIPGAGDAR